MLPGGDVAAAPLLLPPDSAPSSTTVGRIVAAAGYQLSVTDSNSFGQSLCATA